MRSTGLLLVALLLVPRTGITQGTPPGAPLGPEFRVNTNTADIQSIPAVASDSSGNFVVVWQSGFQDGSNYGVFGQRYASSGAPIGPEFPINTYTTSAQFFPAVASDSSGNFVVVWNSYGQDGSSYGVFGQRYTSTGAPLGPEFRVNTYTTNYQLFPAVASDSSGNFVVAWSSHTQDGSNDGVFGQRYASSGAPLGPEFRVNTYTTGGQGDPAVGSDSAGNFVVVWQGAFGGLNNIFGQRFASNGAPLGSEFRLNTTYDEFVPAVSSDSSGNFVVVWQRGSPGAGVFGQLFANNGAPLGPEFRVNTYTTYGGFRPAVASDSFGNFGVVWYSFQDDFSYGVFGQRFASNGAPLGPEFRVNTYTPYNQWAPSVASDSAGNFVVVWQSYYQDGSSYGVFGQRYGQIVPVELMHWTIE